jgi:hypothetical protein
MLIEGHVERGHFDDDGYCRCGRPCCVDQATGECLCSRCTCQGQPKADAERLANNRYQGAYNRTYTPQPMSLVFDEDNGLLGTTFMD